MTTVGILALQGDFSEHRQALERLGAAPVEVRTPADLERVDAVVIPGGESTTMMKLLASSGLRAPLEERLAAGLPALGTCAGLILLSRVVEDGTADQRPLAAIDVVSRRNGYGRQVRSFEAQVDLAEDAEPLVGVFIRAPRIVAVGTGVEIVATMDGEPVAAAAGAIMVASFHPELTGDDRLHRRFLERARAAHPIHS